jgi:hypothetical protein
MPLSDIDLFYEEQIDFVVKPHILSFLGYHLFAVYLIGISFLLREFYNYLNSNLQILYTFSFLDILSKWLNLEIVDIILLSLFWIVLIISGIFISVLWKTKKPLIYILFIGFIGTFLELSSLVTYQTFFAQKQMIKLVSLNVAAIVSMIIVEIHRKGQTFIITNNRIITSKGIIRKEKRELKYDKITDIYINQGIIGKIFNFGTVIPVSRARKLILRVDPSQTLSDVVSAKKDNSERNFEGENSIQKQEEKNFSLYGVKDPKKIRIIIGNRQLDKKANMLKTK